MPFVQSHPLQFFTEQEKQIDYTEKDNHYIRCLQSIEQIMDIDAFILDYCNERMLYLTKNSFFRKFLKNNLISDESVDFTFLSSIASKEDLSKIENINKASFDFYYSLPPERRLQGSYTLDIRIRDFKGDYKLVNYNISVLDITNDGKIRLGLCVLSYPISKIPGKAYFKFADTNTVYEYIEKPKKFIEVKTQKITSKAKKILELVGQGNTEQEIANILGVSLYTVKYHKKMIFKQLNVRNTAEAIQWISSQKTLSENT